MAKKAITNKPEKSSPFRTVIQSLPFHQFDEVPKLVAMYKDTTLLGDEENIDKETGKPKTFLANVMVDMSTGEEKYVQNAYSIEKAIRKAKIEFPDNITDVVFEIEFLGKTMLHGKPFNQFKIGYCLYEDYEKFAG